MYGAEITAFGKSEMHQDNVGR